MLVEIQEIVICKKTGFTNYQIGLIFTLSSADHKKLCDAGFRQGEVQGRLLTLGFDTTLRALLEICTAEIVSSEKLEGEEVAREDLRRSLARRLGLFLETHDDRKADALASLSLDAITNHSAITKERLFGWHAALFPTGYSGLKKIVVADWRKSAMA